MDFYSNIFVLIWMISIFIGIEANNHTDFLLMGTTPRTKGSKSGIVKYHLMTGKVEKVPVELPDYITTSAYDPVRGRVYWGAYEVMSVNAKGLQELHVGDKPKVIVTGIAFDPVRQLLYYSDPLKGTIVVVDIKGGSNTQTNFMTDVDSPWKIGLDMKNEYVYWASYSRLERARMDGTGRQTVYSNIDDLDAYYAITYFDEDRQKLYACERSRELQKRNTTTIVEVDTTDFSFRSTTVRLGCRSMAGNSTHLYLSSRTSIEGVYAKRKDKFLDREVSWDLIIDNVTVPLANGLHYARNSTEGMKDANCSLTCGDSAVCLYTSSQSRCRCATDYHGENCQTRDFRRTYPAILQSQDKQIYGMLATVHQTTTFKRWNMIRYINDFKKPGAIAVDVQRRLLYVNFPELNSTFVADLNSMQDSPSHQWKQLPFLKYTCNDMIYDWEAETILCTVTSAKPDKNGIVTASTRTGVEKWLLSNTSSKPKAIAVDPMYGIVYWTDLSDNSVKKMTGDGKSMTTLVTYDNTTQPVAIALAFVQELIFVAAGDHVYEYSYRDKFNRRQPIGNISVTGLDVHPPHVVYSDNGNGKGLLVMNYMTGKQFLLTIEVTRAVAILHETRQPRWNPRSNCHAGCAICVSVPKQIQCICPENKPNCTPPATTVLPTSESRTGIDEPKKLGLGGVVGMVVGGTLGLIVIGLLIALLITRCRKKRSAGFYETTNHRLPAAPNEYGGYHYATEPQYDYVKYPAALTLPAPRPSPTPSKSTIYIHFTSDKAPPDTLPELPPRPQFLNNPFESIKSDEKLPNDHNNPLLVKDDASQKNGILPGENIGSGPDIEVPEIVIERALSVESYLESINCPRESSPQGLACDLPGVNRDIKPDRTEEAVLATENDESQPRRVIFV